MIELSGIVVEGKHIGHKIGFPTANIKPDASAVIPDIGVYAGEIHIDDGDPIWYRCLIDHGFQPTIPSGRETIEVFILDFHRNIYGARVELRFTDYLREEVKFDSVKSLQAQLKRDEQTVRAL